MRKKNTSFMGFFNVCQCRILSLLFAFLFLHLTLMLSGQVKVEDTQQTIHISGGASVVSVEDLPKAHPEISQDINRKKGEVKPSKKPEVKLAKSEKKTAKKQFRSGSVQIVDNFTSHEGSGAFSLRDNNDFQFILPTQEFKAVGITTTLHFNFRFLNFGDRSATVFFNNSGFADNSFAEFSVRPPPRTV